MDAEDVRARLHGFIRQDVSTPKGEQFIIDMGFLKYVSWNVLKWPMLIYKFASFMIWNVRNQESREVKVHNARILEKESGLSKRAFFEKYGFVLLNKATEMRPEDWVCVSGNGQVIEKQSVDNNKVKSVYIKEIEPLVEGVLGLGGKQPIEYPEMVMRRGPGTAAPFYAKGIHQDYALNDKSYGQQIAAYTPNPEAKREMLSKFREKFDQDGVSGLMLICLWRPVLPMKEPVKVNHLCVCDPNTVSMDDVVSSGLLGFAPTDTPTAQLALKYNEKQKWYYYPEMNNEEILVFKQFHYMKSDGQIPKTFRTCFHTAFDTPLANGETAEPRQSCEYRIPIFLSDSKL